MNDTMRDEVKMPQNNYVARLPINMDQLAHVKIMFDIAEDHCISRQVETSFIFLHIKKRSRVL